MSYRILVDTEAGQALRSLSGHVVERVGRLLAELSEAADASFAPGSQLARPAEVSAPGQRLQLDLDDCVLLYEIDTATRTLSVLAVEPRTSGAGLPAASA